MGEAKTESFEVLELINASTKAQKILAAENWNVVFQFDLDGEDEPFYIEIKDGKGNLISFFHYDPRRWNSNKFIKLSFSGKWDDPFKFLLQTHSFNSLQKSLNRLKLTRDILNPIFFKAIGFKMYTALGYRPDDVTNLPHLAQFYAKCSQPDLDIPIICHCSRGGVTTHDWRYYYKKQTPNLDFEDKEAKEWYTREFVSPFAWERVLQKFPNLKLCLAHFGGEECWGKQREKQNCCREKTPPSGNPHFNHQFFVFRDQTVTSSSLSFCFELSSLVEHKFSSNILSS